MKRVNCGYCFKNFMLVNGKCPYCLKQFKNEDSKIICTSGIIKDDFDDKDDIEEIEDRSFNDNQIEEEKED